MANLLVRGLDDSLVLTLKQRAGQHGHSAEAEHRAILEAALTTPKRRSLAQLLAQMPDVGLDADFERARAKSPRKTPQKAPQKALQNAPRVFD